MHSTLSELTADARDTRLLNNTCRCDAVIVACADTRLTTDGQLSDNHLPTSLYAEDGNDTLAELHRIPRQNDWGSR